MNCPMCGAQIDEDSRFCPVCGTEIPGVAASAQRREGSIWNSGHGQAYSESPSMGREGSLSVRICPYCGWEVDYGQAVCTRCGQYIPQSIDEFPSVGDGNHTVLIDEGASDVPPSWGQDGPVDQPAVTPAPDERRESVSGQGSRDDRRRRKAIIVGAIAAVLVVAVVGVVLYCTQGASVIEEPPPDPPAKPETGRLVGHFTMSDAGYGTEDFMDAIILDRDGAGNSTLLYRGHMMSGIIERSSEEETTYIYTMSDIKDSKGTPMDGAEVTIEIPKTMSKDNIAGDWRICYRNGETAISDWATVESDGTGTAGFSYQFDIFTQNRDYTRANASRRSWKKTGDGRYRVTAPDKNGVERLIYIAD